MSSPIHLAQRAQAIPPFYVMDILARAQALQSEGRDIIHMEVGEPDFPCPEPVLAAAREFLGQADVRYTPAAGLPALREAIATHYARDLGATVAPERIVITAGASAALLLALAALTNPGDEWLLSDPGYPCNRQFVQAFNGVARMIEVDAASRYQPTPAQLATHWNARTRGLLVATPSNPTGTLLSPAELEALGKAVRERGGSFLVDEIYQGLTYGRAASTVLAHDPEAFVINSFSKYFGMTGWRLGWLVVPEGYARAVEMLAQHLYIAPSTPAQHAALAALSLDTRALLEARRAEFDQRRQTLVSGLRKLGFTIGAEPEGAFYVYAGLPEGHRDSMRFATDLLEQAGVALTPGLDFGAHRAEQHVRVAYTTSVERIEEALARMGRMLQG